MVPVVPKVQLFQNLTDACVRLAKLVQIHHCLIDHMLRVGLPEQAGFTKGRSCADATAALKIALQQQRNANNDSYVLFLDLVKAFDSVNRELL